MVLPLKFVNENFYPTLVGMWLFIHARVNVNFEYGLFLKSYQFAFTVSLSLENIHLNFELVLKQECQLDLQVLGF